MLNTFSIDIGGTFIKAMLLDERGKAISERAHVPTPRPATTDAILGELFELASKIGTVSRVTIGFPGVVKSGVTLTAVNLDPSWIGFPLASEVENRLGVPVRVMNDAGVQGHGVVRGEGTEMVLTLGTGMGCALFTEGHYVPNLELAHHPFRKGKTYEDYIGDAALEKVGKKRWNIRVGRVVAQIQPIFNPDTLYLGGGNAQRLTIALPENVRIVNNDAALHGGFLLWQPRVRALRA